MWPPSSVLLVVLLGLAVLIAIGLAVVRFVRAEYKDAENPEKYR